VYPHNRCGNATFLPRCACCVKIFFHLPSLHFVRSSINPGSMTATAKGVRDLPSHHSHRGSSTGWRLLTPAWAPGCLDPPPNPCRRKDRDARLWQTRPSFTSCPFMQGADRRRALGPPNRRSGRGDEAVRSFHVGALERHRKVESRAA
jgi:hypothetical protein